MDAKENDIQVLIEEYEKYAAEHGFQLNPNRKIVEHIVRALLKKETDFGYRYCPCRVMTGKEEEDRKIVCPCVYHEDEIKNQGCCHCHLFYKK